MNVSESGKLRWILCPRCGSKTRTKIRDDTSMKNFPLYCPKCKGEYLISMNYGRIRYLDKPDV